LKSRIGASVIKLKITTVLALAIASVAIITLGAAAPANTIDLASKDGLGEYLVDQDGMTLYYFANDTPDSEMSSCGDTCIQYWPPFHTGQIIIPLELSWFDFGTIYREDGAAQTTYKGWPLYYYTNDYNPGDVRGYEIDDVWFVAGPDLMP
jgi:predicted lipoprotein with Yx(FWY)xxD motif